MKIKLTLTTLIIITINYSLSYAQKDTTDITKMSLEDLMNIEVVDYGNKKQQSASKIPAKVIVISHEEIKNNGWVTLEEILSNVPGMYMINDYLWFGSENYGVRGFFTTGAFSNLIVMINGVKQKEDWYNSFPLSKVNVPVETIDRIEIIRGPMSVMYGSNALLGSMNIITNKKQKVKRFTAGGGSLNSYNVSGKIADADKLKNISYSINFGIHGNKGIDAKYANMMSDAQRKLTEINLPIDAGTYGQLSDNRMFVGASLDYKEFYFHATQTYTKRGVVDFYPGYEDGHKAEIESSNFLVGYEHIFKEKNYLKTEIAHYNFRDRLNYKHDNDTNSYTFSDVFSSAVSFTTSYIETYNKFSWALDFNTRYVYKNKAIVDAPNLHPSYNNFYAGLDKGGKINTALSLNVQYAILPKLTMIGGIRAEYTPKYDIFYRIGFDPNDNNANYQYRVGTYKFNKIIPIPQIAVIYSFSSKNNLKLMYGRGIKEPSVGENMDIVRFPERPQLEPAYMETVELNYLTIPIKVLSLDFGIFMNKAENLISRTNTMQNGTMKLFNTNSGKLRTLGVDLGVKYKISDIFNTKINFSYQKTSNLQSGYEDIEQEYAPKILGYFNSSVKFWKSHTFALSVYYVDEMQSHWVPASSTGTDDTRTAEQLVKDGKRLGNPSPAYMVINANLRFNNLFKKGLFVGLYVHNIANTEIRYPVTKSNDMFDKGTIGYGRMFILKAGIEF